MGRRLSSRDAGFTLVELMIVIGIIGIIASIAIPNILAARQTANERAAMATLRTVCTAQVQFQSACKADEDDDGTGEFGGLGELAGACAVRGGAVKVPTDLAGAFRNVSANGEVERAGYYYRAYLPDSGGVGIQEQGGGGYNTGVLAANLAETTYCVYAWPANTGRTGMKVFFVNQKGELTMTSESPASGAATADIVAGSAFLTGTGTTITGDVAVGTVGNDGCLWRKPN
jgi:type IV pilus assembly protein PilA